MDFYFAAASPNCRKVDAVSKQLGIELNYKPVDLAAGEHKSPSYLALNPNGKVPTLVDGDVTLWESNAICCYVATKSDNDLWPKSNARYDIMRWQAWELAHFGAAAGELVSERLLKPMFGGQTDEDRCKVVEEQFNRFAAVLDGHLSKNKYLVGGALTVADFCVAAPLTYAVPGRLPLDAYPNIRNWLSVLNEEPGWSGSAPPPM